jgi:hypothetical protein
MGKIIDFNWANESAWVVRPVQAVAVYPGQHGVVIRQQRMPDRDNDDVVTIPHHSLGIFINRLQSIYDNNCIDATYEEVPEMFPTHAAE